MKFYEAWLNTKPQRDKLKALKEEFDKYVTEQARIMVEIEKTYMKVFDKFVNKKIILDYASPVYSGAMPIWGDYCIYSHGIGEKWRKNIKYVGIINLIRFSKDIKFIEAIKKVKLKRHSRKILNIWLKWLSKIKIKNFQEDVEIPIKWVGGGTITIEKLAFNYFGGVPATALRIKANRHLDLGNSLLYNGIKMEEWYVLEQIYPQLIKILKREMKELKKRNSKNTEILEKLRKKSAKWLILKEL